MVIASADYELIVGDERCAFEGEVAFREVLYFEAVLLEALQVEHVQLA